MKKLITVLLIAVLAVATCVALVACKDDEATEKIVMYTESGFAPYEFVGADGKITGVDVAIMSEVAERMGRKLEIKDVAFDFITQYVFESDGYSVGAAGLTINEERKQSVDFSNVYASTTLVIISNKDLAYASVADLAGKKVGVQQGTSGDLIISDASTDAGYTYTDEDDNSVTVKAAGASVQKYATYALAYQELSSGRIDAILMDKLPAQSLIATRGGDQFIIKDATDLLQEDFGIAFKKGAPEDLVNTVNAVINEWLENGNLTKYTDYFTALDNYEKNGGEAPVAPEGLKLSWNV